MILEGVEPELLAGLSLRRLSHLVAVAQAGSITAAAEALFMSPSAVSGSITELERALQSDLLVRRRGHGVTLTPTGTYVLDRARSLLSEAAELSYLARSGEELVGPLAVGCFVTLAPTVLPRLLVEFEALHPKVTLDFIDGSQDDIQAMLLAGDLDMALMYELDLSVALDWIVLDEPRAYALFGEDHHLAKQDSVTLEQLATEPLVLFDAAPSTSYVHVLFEGRGLEPKVRYRTHSYELTRSIIARNPSYYAILVQRPSNRFSYERLPIIEREIEPLLPACPVILAWPKEHRPSPRAQAFADVARRLHAGPTDAGSRSHGDAGRQVGGVTQRERGGPRRRQG